MFIMIQEVKFNWIKKESERPIYFRGARKKNATNIKKNSYIILKKAEVYEGFEAELPTSSC